VSGIVSRCGTKAERDSSDLGESKSAVYAEDLSSNPVVCRTCKVDDPRSYVFRQTTAA